MYDWLPEALEGESSSVVTANLRLARTLLAEFGEQQVANGLHAWQTPAIHVWTHFLHGLFDSADDPDELPSRLNVQQCRLLWEHCLQQEVDAAVVNITSLARLARDGWVRMNDWNLDPDACANAASGQDQRIFARAVQRYRSELKNNRWIDDATMPGLICTLVADGKLALPRRLTLVGFDRITPQVKKVLDLFTTGGSRIDVRKPGPVQQQKLFRCENAEAELRAAGAWAARELETNPESRIAVVVSGLDKDAANSRRLLSEGLVPGWQYGGHAHAAAVNVSYGRKLSEYPAIHAALMALRWMVSEITGADVSLLLRSPFLGIGLPHGRSRLELRLRDWPDRQWSAERLCRALDGNDDAEDSKDWLTRFARYAETGRAMPDTARPSYWAGMTDELLKGLNWPGEGTLNSLDFQLVNRWRDLLNEFAQLELVAPKMSLGAAVARISAMANETLFQAEIEGSVLSVLGPLEAAGMEFDSLWVAGLDGDEWPPQGHPSPLLSRELQLQHGMPDAEPQDTSDYARRVLNRLRASAATCYLSYAGTSADEKQLPTALLSGLDEIDAPNDPGWHAETLLSRVALQEVADPAPPMLADEVISGGAATINSQMYEPFTAFARGRLGVSWIQAFTAGIAANIRGSLVHDALFNLYANKPSQADIKAWNDEQITTRIAAAIDLAFERHERYADNVLRQLFRLERRRTESLLRSVIEIDCQREAFQVGTVERSIAGSIGALKISLRCDRIDELEDADIVILDYKTGSRKKFLSSGEPTDMQLVVYACMSDRRVAGLGLFNVDSKFLGIDGAGPALNEHDGWENALDGWKNQVVDAANQIAGGDVRINLKQPDRDASTLNLLSRSSELKREL